MAANIWSLWLNTVKIRLRWVNGRFVLWVFSAWVLVIALGALVSVKLAQQIDARGQMILRRVDILRNRLNDHEPIEATEGWRYPVRALFGNRLWEAKFLCVFYHLFSLCQRLN
jgi:hypothetical protein